MSKPYYALLPADELAKNRVQRISSVRSARRASTMSTRLLRNWLQYYGLNDWSASLADNLFASGPGGERVELRVNHLRNIIQHMVQMTTSTRPDLTCKAENMDIKSLKQVQVGNAIIEHYLDFENIWNYVDTAIEFACFLHGGFIHAWWDPSAGDPYAGDGQGNIVYQGDFRFRNLSLFDVVFDPKAQSWRDIYEITVRDWANKYNLMAEHPDLESKIDSQRTRREWEPFDTPPPLFIDSDDSLEIEVHTFYHSRTPACPMGRKTIFLADGTVLEDGALEYNRIPVFRIAASEIHGTPFAWCPATDLASLQESINKSASTIATNHFAFGVQNIWAPRGSKLDITQFTGGLNFIEGSPVGPNGGKPEVLDLLKTPKEVFEWMMMQERTMETLSGVNQVTRGNPEHGLTAGVALALVNTQSMQFLSPLQRSYAECARDLSEFIIATLRDKATTPRLLHIVGKGRREALVHFQAGDIDAINRVSVEMGNPMARTPAGRMQLAQSVIEAGAQLKPNEILEIIDKGRLEPLTKGVIDALDNIIMENELLRDGTMVPVLVGDDHRLHIEEHVNELQNPDMRMNVSAQGVLMQHIQQHVMMYMGGDIIRGIIEGIIPPPYALSMMAGGGMQATGGVEEHKGQAPPKPGAGPQQPQGGAPQGRPPPAKDGSAPQRSAAAHLPQSQARIPLTG